ncbi:MAG TPA: thiamine biosynthesis protein ThiS [Blastocatellia bacterium]|nr:thiamine biosynthesis protein ThiS [Blastocatellia bacterium]
MLIQVNGERQEVSDGLPLSELVIHLKLRAEQIAIELNHEVLRRAAWAATTLKPGDRIEIVHFVGGGVTS